MEQVDQPPESEDPLLDDEGEVEEVEGATCPGCQSRQVHERLKERPKGLGLDVLARCEGCGHVHTIHLRPPKEVSIPFTLSEGAVSRAASIAADEDEKVFVDDVFDHEDGLWKVTRIDGEEGRSVTSAMAQEISAAWAVRCDLVTLKLTMTVGEASESTSLVCEPDRVFSCGSIIEVEDRKWRIRALHTGVGRTLTGRRLAHQIRRIFLHPPPEKEQQRRHRRQRRGGTDRRGRNPDGGDRAARNRAERRL